MNRDIVFFYLPDDQNGFLSNWYLSDFEVAGLTFCCFEQFLMWSKARVFKDAQSEAAIMGTDDPAQIKRLGRGVRGYDDYLWKGLRQAVAYRGLFAKFSQDWMLGTKLLMTGDALLAEASPRDTVWGIGVGMDDPARFDLSSWRGSNIQGFTLMEVRRALAEDRDVAEAAKGAAEFLSRVG